MWLLWYQRGFYSRDWVLLSPRSIHLGIRQCLLDHAVNVFRPIQVQCLFDERFQLRCGAAAYRPFDPWYRHCTYAQRIEAHAE